MVKGQGVYNANCAACHQPAGQGLAGAFPPLAGSDFLKGDRKKVMGAALFTLMTTWKKGRKILHERIFHRVLPREMFLKSRSRV